MKLTTTHKVLIGIALGGGVAYLLNKRKKAGAEAVTQKVVTSAGAVEDAENPTSREGKVEYILTNADTSATEEASGFGGERFQYNPMLGYATPTGMMHETDAGAQMILSREGDLANEVFFNAEGEATDDPTEEAEGLVNEMTDEEVDLAYKMVKAKKNNPDLPASAIANKLGWGDGAKAMFAKVILPRIQDIKALKKSPKWKAKWEQRKAKFKAKLAKMQGRGKSAQAMERKIDRMGDRLDKRGGKIKDGMANRKDMTKEERQADRQATRENRQKNLANQVSGNGRKEGAMWGGHRNDGTGTNPNRP